MELERCEIPAAGLGLGVQPSRREVPDLISWVQCFGVYAAVVSVKHPDRVLQLLAYQTTIVRETRRCGGRGWLSYDAMFRQQAAISPSVDGSKLNNSLYSTTFLQQQNGRGRTCVHCMETDHSSQDCALAPLHTVLHNNNPREEPSSDANMDKVRSNRNRGTKVCYSWNDGRCAVPYCRYRHNCTKCSSPFPKALPREKGCARSRVVARDFRALPQQKYAGFSRVSACSRRVSTSLYYEQRMDSLRSCALSSLRLLGYKQREFGWPLAKASSKTSPQ